MDRRTLVGVIAAVALATSGCSTTEKTVEFAYPPSDPNAVAGDLTVLTQRTDLVGNGVLDGYAAQFERVYPNVRVHFEGITDYEGEVGRRLGTKNYGDVLMIPAAVPQYDYPKYFAPLGPGAAVASRYRFTDRATVADKAYGIAESGSANGFVYNRTVWAAAGITDWPTTPAQFLADLQRIKDRTGSIPYYTNYKDAWPLTGWSNNVGSVSCDPLATTKLSVTDTPWAPGGDLNVIDTLLYDIVKRGFAEKDPAGTDWERSKALLAQGDVATMQLGSWAVAQMQEEARRAGKDPAAIGFMPFPVQKDGVFCSVVVAGYQQAISARSANKAAARAWIDWFTEKSGAAAREGAIPSLAAAPLPALLKPLADKGVKFVDRTEADTAQINAIDGVAGIGLDRPDYRKKLIDIARGVQPGTSSEYFADLDRRWSEAARHATS